MDLVEAYRTFNLAPGAPEAQVRAVHADMTAAWNPERFRADPAMYPQAIAATQRLHASLAAIAAVGFAPSPYVPSAQQYPPPPPGYAAPHPAIPQLPSKRSQAGKNIALGIVLLTIGIGITVGTMDAAEGGGTYIVAYGPIALGAITLIKGLAQLV